MSVEGYWHWLGVEDCLEKEKLRKVYGYYAKKLGKEIRVSKGSCFDDDFKNII